MGLTKLTHSIVEYSAVQHFSEKFVTHTTCFFSVDRDQLSAIHQIEQHIYRENKAAGENEVH